MLNVTALPSTVRSLKVKLESVCALKDKNIRFLLLNVASRDIFKFGANAVLLLYCNMNRDIILEWPFLLLYSLELRVLGQIWIKQRV